VTHQDASQLLLLDGGQRCCAIVGNAAELVLCITNLFEQTQTIESLERFLRHRSHPRWRTRLGKQPRAPGLRNIVALDGVPTDTQFLLDLEGRLKEVRE
jgi:hypothetical protein